MRPRMGSPWVSAIGVLLATAALAIAADRPAGQVLKEIDAIKIPTFDRAKSRDRAYIQQYSRQRTEAVESRNKLILELYKAAPDHERIAALMAERWGSTPPYGARGDELLKEIDETLAHTKNEKLRVEGTYVKAQAQIYKSRQGDGHFDAPAIEEFLRLAPRDRRASQLIYIAAMSVQDEKARTVLEERLLKDFPDSRFASMIKGRRRQTDAIGKPFELEFTDAISGSTVSMNALKGKVVVIDFWATWCGPCVAEMPEMKKLYQKYHPRGVEFIGVSLDRSKEQGGLDALKKFVKENEISWPQYYQGQFWESEFSSSWGINAIPTMFVVDQAGNLASVEAGGKLDELIPRLLKKKAPAPAGSGE